MIVYSAFKRMTAFFKKVLPSTRLGWLALAFFAAISIPVSIYGQNERSGWNLMTLPVDYWHLSNSLLGYVYMLGSEPIHKENTSFVHQVMLLSGFDGFKGQNFYFLRPVYSLLVSLILPFFGLVRSFIVVNYIGWSICAWISWRLTRKLFADELAAFFSVILVATGIGFIAHIGDYSAHLLAFTAYYAGILVLYESKVWCERKPLRIHLTTGILLAIACLTYTSSLALVPAYFLLALPFKSLPSVILSSVVALSSRQVWQLSLNTLGITFANTEGDYLRDAIAGWSKVFLEDGLEHYNQIDGSYHNAILFTTKRLSEFLFFDHPLITILAVMSLGYFYFSRLRYANNGKLTVAFLTYLFIIPLAAGLVYSTRARARGYLVYGISLIAYSLASYLLSLLIRWSLKIIKLRSYHTKTALAIASIATTFCLIALHLAWSTAHLSGNLIPLKSYYIGHLMGLSASPRMNAISLTGQEVTPKLLGGNSSLLKSGFQPIDPSTTLPSKQSFYNAVLLRFTILIYLLSLVFLLKIRAKTKILWLSIITVYCLTSLALSQSFVRSIPAISNIDAAIQLQSGSKLKYEILLSEELKVALIGGLNDTKGARSLVFQVPIFLTESSQSDGNSELSPIEVYVNDQKISSCLVRLPHSPFQLACSQLESIKFISKAQSLSVEISPDYPLSIGGWQQVGLKNRFLTVELSNGSHLDASVLPAVELRVLDDLGRLIVAGF